MKSYFLKTILVLTFLLFAFQLFADQSLVVNGSGIRNKYFMDVYRATLLVPSDLKGAAGNVIVDADKPMAVNISILSGLIDREKFVTSISEAFDKARAAGYPVDKNLYLKLFDNINIKKGDRIENSYTPGKGLTVSLNSKVLGTIPGTAMKRAFFGLFLGSKPVEAKLKRGMLGQ